MLSIPTGALVAPTGLPGRPFGEAPTDGQTYGRNGQGKSWLPVVDAADLTTALAGYVTTGSLASQLADFLPLTGGTLSGGLTVAGGIISDAGATITGLVSTNALAISGTIGSTPPAVQINGDISMNGDITTGGHFNFGNAYWLRSFDSAGTGLINLIAADTSNAVHVGDSTKPLVLESGTTTAFGDLVTAGNVICNQSVRTRNNYPFASMLNDGTTLYNLMIMGTDNTLYISEGTVPITIRSGTTTTTGNFVVNGSVTITVDLLVSGTPYANVPNFNTTSDPRLKDNIEDYQGGLKQILALNPIAFQYNGKGGTPSDGIQRIGLNAEKVREVMPEMVSVRKTKLDPEDTEETDVLMSNAGPLLYAVVNAIKELAGQVAELRAQHGS